MIYFPRIHKNTLEMIRNNSLPLLILIVVSLGVGLSIGYWSGTLRVPEEDDYVRENLWWLSTEVVRDDIHGQWNISTILENRGGDNSTVGMVILDGAATRSFGENVTVSPLPLLIEGAFNYCVTPPNGTITTTVKYGTTYAMKYRTLNFTSGTTIEIKYHTNAGLDYPLSVTLP